MSERRVGGGVKMAGDKKKAPAKRPKAARAPTETDALTAALAVSQRLDLEGQLHAFLDIAKVWAEATDGVTFGPDAEGVPLAPLAGTLQAGDPRQESLRIAVSSRRGDDWADGAGPLAADGVRALAVPLRGEHDPVIGVVVLVDPARDAAEALTDLAHRVRPAIANAAQVRAIRDLTIKDDTASCFNRRYFEDFILEEMSRANRFKTPMSLIFFDMDNLKDVNTRLGHAAGSRTLLEVSERVRGKIRKFDKLFRFGGDEFCIVLPETEWHGATEVAERVREAISGRPFLAGSRATHGGQPMTASFGIASFPLHARTKEELVQRADRAMQSVKSTTKNGIATAERRQDADAP
jgi:diguanylate cyclase (GGDEF)-like protein